MDESIDERIILIRGDDSTWYDQAIFILKPGMFKSKGRADLVAEAEGIIAAFFNEIRDTEIRDTEILNREILNEGAAASEFALNPDYLSGAALSDLTAPSAPLSPVRSSGPYKSPRALAKKRAKKAAQTARRPRWRLRGGFDLTLNIIMLVACIVMAVMLFTIMK